MQRALIIVVGLVVIVLGALQFTGGLSKLMGGGGDAAVAAAAQNATKAADSFAALAKDSTTSGKPPRLADPAAAPLIDAVFNTDLLKTKTLGDDDLNALSDWGLAATRLGNVYILSGTGETDLAKVVENERLAKLTDQNVVAFQPEAGRYLDAQVAIQSAIARILAANKSFPATALAKIRDGMTQSLAGTLATLALPGLDPAWRQARVTTLQAATAPTSAVLQPDQCKLIRDTADEVAAEVKDAPLGTQLKAFNTALKC